jgi:hypothetical protein
MTTGFVRAMIVIQDAKRAIKVAKRAIQDGKRAATLGVHGQALLVKNPLATQTLKANSLAHLFGLHVAKARVAKAKVTLPAHREIAGSSGQDLVIAGVMAKGHVSDQSHHSVIAHPAVNVRRLVIGLRARKVIAHHVVNVRHSVIGHRALIAHVLTGTAHPWTLKAEKNIPREHLGNVRLNALALGRDRDRETVRALVKGHASEQDPHQVIEGLALKGAASAIDPQEVNVRRAATVHHAVKDEAHAVKDEALVIARNTVVAPKEVTVLREVIVHHAAKAAVLVIACHAAQNVPGASALIPEVHGAAPDPSTLDRLQIETGETYTCRYTVHRLWNGCTGCDTKACNTSLE